MLIFIVVFSSQYLAWIETARSILTFFLFWILMSEQFSKLMLCSLNLSYIFAT